MASATGPISPDIPQLSAYQPCLHGAGNGITDILSEWGQHKTIEDHGKRVPLGHPPRGWRSTGRPPVAQLAAPRGGSS
jgi:hypothetical protein